jgi:DNA-binding transcriptional regulator YiaG
MQKFLPKFSKLFLKYYTEPCIITEEMEKSKEKKRQWNKEEIRALRKHLNLTQVKLAETLGTRQQTISEWEKGMYQPRGTSATLLNIVAERSGFIYGTEGNRDRPNKNQPQ